MNLSHLQERKFDMADFYGTLQGQKGEATRLGSKKSGIRSTLQTWKHQLAISLHEYDGKIYAGFSISDLRTGKTIESKTIELDEK